MTATAERTPRTVSFVSLGCAKNLVDSEVMIAKLGAAGWALTGAHVARLDLRARLYARDDESRLRHDEVHALDRAARCHVRERALRVD